jgi:hypothetical protein
MLEQKKRLALSMARELRKNQTCESWGIVLGFSNNEFLGLLPVHDPEIYSVPRLAVHMLLADEIIFVAMNPAEPGLYSEDLECLRIAAQNVPDPNASEPFPSPWRVNVLAFFAVDSNENFFEVQG